MIQRGVVLFRKIPLFKVFFYLFFLIVLFGLTYVTVVAGRFFWDRQEIVAAINENKDWLYSKGRHIQKEPIRILSRNREVIGELLPERDSRMTRQKCQEAKWLRLAAVSSEDRYFYEHNGVSIRGLMRAVWNNIRVMGVREGAGTITMQLARNMFTDRSFSLHRKIRESLVALQLESMLTKDEILCLYLNKIYMGEGRVGAGEASWYYFRKPPEKLKATEAAMIVGLFPSPVRYSPQNDILESLKKQEMTLDTLIRDGYYREDEKKEDIKRFIKRYEVWTDEKAPHPGTIGVFGASRDFRIHHPAPAANQRVKQRLYEIIPEEMIRKGGLRVYTTIDYVRQQAALNAIRNKIEEVREKIQKNGTKTKLDTRAIANRFHGSLVSINPSTGEILALVGGYSISDGTNLTYRIWKMQRQPGSVIKGLLYANAIEDGLYDIDSVVNDEEIRIGRYKPRNWYHGYKGEMTLRSAVAQSVNTIAVKTIDDLGVDRFRSMLGSALELGYFETRNRFTATHSLALGSAELTPMELTRIYGIISNGGFLVRPYLIQSVEDANGTVLFDSGMTPSPSIRLLSEETAARTLFLLRGVIEDPDGTASFIQRARNKTEGMNDFPMAGKSGTVQTVSEVRKKYPGLRGVHDAWFVGMVPDETTIIWFGQDEGAPFPGSGSSTAGSAFWNYSRIAHKNRITGDFPYSNILANEYGEFLIRLAEEKAAKEAEMKEEQVEESTQTNQTQSTNSQFAIPQNQTENNAASSTIDNKNSNSEFEDGEAVNDNDADIE